jgi:phage head maturation protease
MTQSALPFSRIHTYPATVKAAGFDQTIGARIVEGTASTDMLDRDQERVNIHALAKSWAASSKDGANPRYLRNHDVDLLLGKVVDVQVAGNRLVTRSALLPEGEIGYVDEAYKLIQFGALESQSIGFNPMTDWKDAGEKDKDGTWWWGKQDGSGALDWMELSAVTIPANRQAYDLSVAKGLGLTTERPWADADAAVIALAPEDHPWDVAGAQKRVQAWAGGDEAKHRQAHLGGADGLLVCDVIDGELQAVWRACAATATRIANAPVAAFTALKALYARFGKQWPTGLEPGCNTKSVTWHKHEDRIYEEVRFESSLTIGKQSWAGAGNIVRHWAGEGRVLSPVYVESAVSTITEASAVLKAGRVLSDDNRTKVEAAKAALEDVLGADDASRAAQDERSQSNALAQAFLSLGG